MRFESAVDSLERKMDLAAKNLQFEKAIEYREKVKKLKNVQVKQKRKSHGN